MWGSDHFPPSFARFLHLVIRTLPRLSFFAESTYKTPQSQWGASFTFTPAQSFKIDLSFAKTSSAFIFNKLGKPDITSAILNTKNEFCSKLAEWQRVTHNSKSL
jgi:hypothetical protein